MAATLAPSPFTSAQDLEVISALISMRECPRVAAPPPPPLPPPLPSTISPAAITSSTSVKRTNAKSIQKTTMFKKRRIQPCPSELSSSSSSFSSSPSPSSLSLSSTFTNGVCEIEDTNNSVMMKSSTTGCSRERRLAALRRYREKKQRRRSASPVIRYQVRKRLADTRPRVRGRFCKLVVSTT